MGGIPTQEAANYLAYLADQQARAAARPEPMVRFVMVWVGEKYGPEYVATLQDMIARNASNLDAFTIECVTDRPLELPAGIRPILAPDWLPGWWAKCALFAPFMPWNIGDRIIYFDLDVAITGRLEDLAERKGIIKDWHWPGYNSSVMVWDHGEHKPIWDKLTPDRIYRAPSAALAPLLPKGQVNGGDQEHIGEVSTWDLFPTDWFASYRSHAVKWPPSGCKAVCFNGWPKPSDFGEDGWARR